MKLIKGLLPLSVFVVLIAALAIGLNYSTESSAQGAQSSGLASAATGAQSGAQVSAGGQAGHEHAAGGTVVVNIRNFAFESDSITIPPGTRVVFVNHDPTPHNVVEGTVAQVQDPKHKPRFESPEFGQGESWEIVFDEEGEYAYACTVAGHYLMGMVGTINVVEGAALDAAATASSVAAASTAAAASNGHGDHGEHAMHPAASTKELGEGLTPLPEGLAELKPFKVEGNVKEFAVEIQEVTHELVSGVTVTAWAFNGTLPGPLLRVEEGDLVRVHFTNTHHQPHTIHWHGIYVDQKYDGVPHTSKAIMPGETYVYEFVAENAGTYMYHCHVDSYRHVDMGMYGALVIEPKSEEKTWDREYTLVLDDWDSNIEPMAAKYAPEHNYFLINGKAFPDLPMLPIKVGETTRVRLINIGYSNVAMHLHGPSFNIVASDGHPLPAPITKDTLDIAPGERYEIEITPTKAGLYPFHAHNLQYVLNNGNYPGGTHIMFEITDKEAK